MDRLDAALCLRAVKAGRAVRYSSRLRSYVDPSAIVCAFVTNPGEESYPVAIRIGRLDRPMFESQTVVMNLDALGVTSNVERLRFLTAIAKATIALFDDDRSHQIILPSEADVSAFRGLVLHASDFDFRRADLEPNYFVDLYQIRKFALLCGFAAVVQDSDSTASLITATRLLRAHYAFPCAQRYTDNVFTLRAYVAPGVSPEFRKTAVALADQKSCCHVVAGDAGIALDEHLRKAGPLDVLKPIVDDLFEATRSTALELLESLRPLEHLALIRNDEDRAWTSYRTRVDDHAEYVREVKTTLERDARSRAFLPGTFSDANEDVRRLVMSEEAVKLWASRNLRYDPVERARARVGGRKIATGVVVDISSATRAIQVGVTRDTEFDVGVEVLVLHANSSIGADARLSAIVENEEGLLLALSFDDRAFVAMRSRVGLELDVVERVVDLRHLTLGTMRSRLREDLPRIDLTETTLSLIPGSPAEGSRALDLLHRSA
jgi:hypothetical protein